MGYRRIASEAEMKLEYELPEFTERQKRNASRLLNHAVIPERRTVYFDTKQSMASFLHEK